MKKKKLKKGVRKGIGVLLIVLSAALIFCGINYSKIFENKKLVIYEDIPKPVVEENTASLIMVGDALIHGAIYDNVRSSGYDF